ncbi:ribosomal protection-like ABC-F family protein [Metabacillus herbersteinensis]|uniref:Ribosomal protection-like ABC-F family protein n=1 Tax=Metabacillus herbersteinensis TaxID=283816 RepID=A0ABV6GJN0_9BACI
MIICSINEISKSFGGQLVIDQLSLELQENDRIGLVGRNGSGKTTIFKLIAGSEQVDKGVIHKRKGLKVGYLAQIPTFSADATTKDVLLTAFTQLMEMESKLKQLENEMIDKNDDQIRLLLKEYGEIQERFTFLGGYTMETELQKVVNGLQIEDLISKPFNHLSGGEQTKVCLGLMLLQSPDLLLLDEPTNHLDIFAVEWLEKFLKEYLGTVVIISHDRYFLDEVATKIFDLEDGEVTVYHTNYTNFIKERQEKLLHEFQAYQEQQKKIKKMKEAIKRLREWANQANPPNEGLHKRARNMERALERMEKFKKPVLDRKKMGLLFDTGNRSGKDVFRLGEVTKSFDQKLLFNRIKLEIFHKDRAAIVGQNGTGKSTILKFLLGEIVPDEGKVQIGSNVRIGYLSQHLRGAKPTQTVIECFRDEVKMTEGDARHVLARFLFFGANVYKKIDGLSGGELMRLRLAQLMHQDVNVLVLDEPTNHLDIDSREVLEEALEEFEGTILAVSHDRYFLNKLFKKTYWLKNQELYAFNGPYQWAKQKLDEQLLKIGEKSEPKIERERAKVIKKSFQAPDKEIEDFLERVEQDLFIIERDMNNEKDLSKLQDLQARRDEKELVRNELYDQLSALLKE